jgi:sulfate adenylyltransferase large subunit
MTIPAEQQQMVPIAHFVKQAGEKSLLRFSTAGSVDDGKSTLIGRMLFDTKGAFDDQIEAVRKSPINRSSGAIDFSLLTDGLRAEREQGITIDVAYRYFATPLRKFIIADTPGHEQYTRNMATGASTSEVAVILVDARKGVLPQSRRHAYISALLGIRKLLIAINKMDLVEYREDVYDAIRRDFEALAPKLRGAKLYFLPVSALEGDNVAARSSRMPWYTGPSLLELLETIEVDESPHGKPFRFPVQLVIRPHLDFRGFAGQVASGRVRVGDPVIVLPSARRTTISRISTFDGDLDEAFAPMSVVLSLADEIDISRGDLIVDSNYVPEISRHLEATLVWMSPDPLVIGKPYLLRHGPHEVTAQVRSVGFGVDVNTLEERDAETLELNEIGLAVIETSQPLYFDPYQANRRTGAVVLIDPLSNLTLAAGIIEQRHHDPANPRAERRRLSFRAGKVTPAERYKSYGHHACAIVIDPHSEVAHALERRLFEYGARVALLEEQVAPVEALLDAGLIVIAGEAAPVERHSRYVFELSELPADPKAAVSQIIGALVSSGVLNVDTFGSGEGI